MSLALQSTLITTPIPLPVRLISSTPKPMQVHHRKGTIHVRKTYLFLNDVQSSGQNWETYSNPQIRIGDISVTQMYFEKPGQRVFDIKIGDVVAIADMDVIEKSGGKYAAHE